MKTNHRLSFGFVLVILLFLCVIGLRLHKEQQQNVRNRQLIDALHRGDTKTAIALVNKGADPNTRSVPPPTPTIKLLLQRLLHLTPPPSVNRSLTAFMLACERPLDLPGNGPLPAATLTETPALLQAMLTHGANVHTSTSDRLTALYLAVGSQQVRTVEWLLQHGADVNVQDSMGQTPLILAVKDDDVSMVRLLLSRGANPNITDVDGNAPLLYAVYLGDTKTLLSELLTHGADPNLRDQSGDSPIQQARKAGHRDIVRMLERSGK